nr:hypothetical protein [Lachnospiraceae bacterium]
MKKTHDYDNAFKTLKTRQQRLFISVVNEAFGKNYPLDSKVGFLTSEGHLVSEEADTSIKIEENINDMLIKIENDVYLVECQSYDDDSMAIRIAEYSFTAARNSAEYDQGHAELMLPAFTIIYLKATNVTPRTTEITYVSPTGEKMCYKAKNVFLSDLSKEEIIDKKLFALIPFYVIRYEKELSEAKDYEKAISDLEYFRDQMIQLRKEKQLTDAENIDILNCSNVVITHITDGNDIEQEVTSVMGGEIIELESERIMRETAEKTKLEDARVMIECFRSDNVPNDIIR